MPSIDYSVIKATLKAWVSTVAGSYLETDTNGDPYIFWVGESHNYQLAPYAALTLTDGGKKGRDYLGYFHDVENDVLIPEVRGIRQLIFAIEIRDRNNADNPRTAVEDLRSALEHTVYMQQLHDGGVSIIDVENFTPSVAVHDDRYEALAVLELRINVNSRLYNTDVSVMPVNNVGLTQQLRDCTGGLIDPDASEEFVIPSLIVGAETVVLGAFEVTL